MRALGMHETVMEVMVNVLGGGDSKVCLWVTRPCILSPSGNRLKKVIRPWLFLVFQQEIRFPRVVTNCCRFLCYFCRISRQNQRSMFDHLNYLLQNSGIGLGECFCWVPALFLLIVYPWFVTKLFNMCCFLGMRGSTPLDVAAASCIDNNELALALQEQDLEMVKNGINVY